MKKSIAIFAILALLLQVVAVSAQYNRYSVPRAPPVDPYVRLGGSFPGTSFYMSNLRAGVRTYHPMSYSDRLYMTNAYYPRSHIEPIYPSRIGGHYKYTGYVNNLRKDFVYPTGTRIGGGSVLSIW